MADQELTRILVRTGVFRTLASPTRIRLDKFLQQALRDDGGIDAGVLGITLVVPYAWYLAGALSTGSNVTSEVVWPVSAAVRRLTARAKTAPSGGEATIQLEANGDVIGTVSIASGEQQGSSAVADATIHAGDVVRLNVTAANSAADVTVTLAYSPA